MTYGGEPDNPLAKSWRRPGGHDRSFGSVRSFPADQDSGTETLRPRVVWDIIYHLFVMNDNKVDVCIVGGGICGILAAHGCVQRGLSFVVVEQGEALGGCWQTLANSYSTLQVR